MKITSQPLVAVFLCTAIGVASPAVAETLGEKTGVNSALGIAPTTRDFVTEAAISDMFEIESSKLAEKRATGPTKDFAAKMVEDHTATTSELKPIAEKVHLDLPSKLDDAHQKKLDKLASLEGEEFIKQYHSDQDSGHKNAMSLFERYGKSGENAELKAWASKTLPHIQEHLKKAQELDK